MLVSALLLAAFTIVVVPVPASSSGFVRDDGKCFLCDEWMGQFFVWHHNDDDSWVGDKQGTNHGMNAEGSCDAIGHSGYNNSNG